MKGRLYPNYTRQVLIMVDCSQLVEEHDRILVLIAIVPSSIGRETSRAHGSNLSVVQKD